jgi:hypothetical protein
MKALFLLLIWGVASFIVYLFAAAIIQDKVREINEMTMVSSSVLNQVARDWELKPFVDITVVDVATNGKACPAEYPEVVMERAYYGA